MKALFILLLAISFIPQSQVADRWVDWQVHKPLTAPRVIEAYGVELIGVFELPAGRPTHGTINFKLLPEWHGCWLIRLSSGPYRQVWTQGCRTVILPRVYRQPPPPVIDGPQLPLSP